MESFYQPIRDVGRDYFDLIELPGCRTLLVLVDVSGKGVSAALLAANIQALVRSIASIDQAPSTFARQINQYLNRYTPVGRFATAVFLVLNRDSGKLIFLNASHNAPIVSGPRSTTVFHGGDTLLLFTDGLTDSISSSNPELLLNEALVERPGTTMFNLKSLIDPAFNEDDVTILLLKRHAGAVFGV